MVEINLELVLKLSRFVAGILVIASALWGFFTPNTYPSWLLAAMTLAGTLWMFFSDIPKLSEHPRIKPLLVPFENYFRRSIFMVFLGLMTVRDVNLPSLTFNFNYGPYAIAAGIIMMVVGIVHFICWLVIFRKKELEAASGAPPTMQGQSGTPVPVGVEPVPGYPQTQSGYPVQAQPGSQFPQAVEYPSSGYAPVAPVPFGQQPQQAAPFGFGSPPVSSNPFGYDNTARPTQL